MEHYSVKMTTLFCYHGVGANPIPPLTHTPTTAHSYIGQLPFLFLSVSPLCLTGRGFTNISQQEDEGRANLKDKEKSLVTWPYFFL
jgi:hypothetical protein